MQSKALAAWRARSLENSVFSSVGSMGHAEGEDRHKKKKTSENTSRGTAHFFQVNIVRDWPFENAISGLNNKDVETMRT